MKKYTIAYGHTVQELVGTVNELIEKGYEPIGGIQVRAFEHTADSYFQSMLFKNND